MLKRLWKYCDKIFQLTEALYGLKNQGFTDKNNEPLLTTILLIAMFMRLKSFNALEQSMNRNKKIWTKILDRDDLPSVDTLARRIRKSDIDGLRRIVKNINHKLRRNKALNIATASNGLMVAGVDGHETFCSEHRYCPACSIRTKTVKEKTVIETYHSYVVCQLTLCNIPILMDIEPIYPGEGELTAGKRLIKRVLKEQGRMVDVFCFDALYLDSDILNDLDKAKKYWIAVIKQENREAYQEIDRLLPTVQPIEIEVDKTQVTIWNLEALVGWDNLAKPFRAVVSREMKEETALNREGEKIKEEKTRNWRWLTNMPSVYSAKIVHKLAHARWNVENRGFNDLVTNCHFDHPYHHHPNALLAMLWIISIAFILSYSFFIRNLKPELKEKIITDRSQLALAIIETFRELTEPLIQIRGP